MDWVVFTYSLPAKLRSSPRVTLWRRLRRLGAVSLVGGVQVLPAQDECIEAFQWLAQEVRQSKGEALVMRVEQLGGMDDQQVIDLFQQARKEEYEELNSQAAELEKTIGMKKKREDAMSMQGALARLRKRYAEIARVDYFDCPEGSSVAARLARVEQALSPNPSVAPKVAPAMLAEYKDKKWVTRPRPHVDRLACAWLIRRFINLKAVIRYAMQPEPAEVAFDMEGAEFGHQGNLCTFETMRIAFKINDPAVSAIAEIVHEVDLRDGRYTRPEIAGIDAVLKGWLLAGLTDMELESQGIALFDGLYSALASVLPGAKKRRK
ncbi:chromate resistance protein [Candidatus Acetothermia bacterium]|nr:chromate resistance protein [Candidatus Acetothermia bacterium]